MKATLALEYIGESEDARLVLGARILDQCGAGLGKIVVGNPKPRKPWVARLYGIDQRFGFAREFLPANWQRKRANAAHSRGVELWFVLESGRVYEVKAPVSWRNVDRYFCRVTDDGSVARISESEARQWLNDRSASMS